MRKTIIGVMGPGAGATEKDKKNAYELGKAIAQKGWVLLSGGRYQGVMDAVSHGAQDAGGLVVGILPAGTSSEVGHSVKVGKPTILLGTGKKAEAFFKEIAPELVYTAKNVNETIDLIKKLLK